MEIDIRDVVAEVTAAFQRTNVSDEPR